MNHTKLLLLLLFLLLLSKMGLAGLPFDTDSSATESSDVSAFSFYIVNDNYIATWLPGEDGHYFGADDFLTGSLLAHYYQNNWQYSLIFNALTLRHFNTRYDLLSLTGSRKFIYQPFQLTAGAGFIIKGEFGGDYFQNGYHKFRAIKRVEIPYSNDKGAGMIFDFKGGWESQNTLLMQDKVHLALYSKIATDHLPSSITMAVSYRFDLWTNVLQTEILWAHKNYLNKIEQYSEMVNCGFIYGSNMKINIYRDYFLDIGFITLPTKNIESDPKYPPYKRDFLPQAWIGFSWQTRGFLISDFIAY